jgi:AAA+ superfamily predicted ATPase
MSKTKTKSKKIQVISPDGFTIDFQKNSYKDMAAAEKAFDAWAKRYEGQGYYSSVRGRIALNELKSYCKFLPL